jgi:hypothetical protein
LVGALLIARVYCHDKVHIIIALVHPVVHACILCTVYVPIVDTTSVSMAGCLDSVEWENGGMMEWWNESLEL